MPDVALSAESRLNNLIERLLATADAAATAGDWPQVRAVAEDVLAVEPDNQQALAFVARASTASAAPVGQRAFMTIVFSDLVDSTPLADLSEPEVVRDLFEIYRAAAVRSFEKYGGKVVNFLGDGIIATFGYPDSHEDDARRAVLASLDLIEGMKAADAVAQQRHGVPAKVRVGIHTGQVVVADIGSGATIERDAIVGVVPNLAARIQGEASPGTVVISDVTHQLIEGEFADTSIGFRNLKGISRPVELFAVDQRHGIDVRLRSERFSRSVLVGRSDLRGRLHLALRGAGEAAVAAQPVLLTGDAGIGKSRVVADIRAEALDLGLEVLDFGCLPFHTASSLWPIRETLERFLGFHETMADEERTERALAMVDALGADSSIGIPQLGAMLRFAPGEAFPPPEIDPPAARQVLLGILRDWITTPVGTAGRLVVFEDLHWADASTLELLGGLAASPSAGIQVVGTCRGELAVAWSGSVLVEPLSPIPDSDAEQLISAIVPNAEFTEGELRSIIDRAEGVPLFVEELARSAAAAPRTGVSPSFPARLQELLAARLKGPSLDLELVQIAATLGPVFDLEMLADVAELAQRGDAFEDLVTKEIVEPVTDGRGTRYRFCHALLCDAAYETQLLDNRRAVHNRIADVLLRRNESAALIAHHLEQGGTAANASGQYYLAALAAHERGANEEAQQLATKGLDLIPQLPNSPERDFAELGLRMIRTLSVVSIFGYGAPTVESDIRRSVEITEEQGMSTELLPAAIALWSFMFTNGQLAEAGQILVRIRERCDSGETEGFDAELAVCEGWQALYEGHLEEARDVLGAGLELLDARSREAKVSPLWSVPNDPVAISAIGMACAETLLGNFSAARLLEQRAIERAESEPFPRGPFSLCFVYIYAAWLRGKLGDDDGARAIGAQLAEVATQHGYVYWGALAAVWGHGDDPEAMRGTMDVLAAIGHRAFVSSYLGQLADLEAPSDQERALATITRAGDEIRATGEELHLPQVLRQTAQIRLLNGHEPSEALADLTAALASAAEHRNAVDRLLSALTLADLDPEVRPADWVDQLRAAVGAFNPSVEWSVLDVAHARLEAE